MNVEIWDCITKAPFGEQASVFTIVRDGDRFTGSNVADVGELPVIEGRIEGDRLIWKMPTDKPMRMTLVGKAVVEGDRLSGTVTMGAFGKAEMTGVRRS
ncbi:MAG: hypothetical protein IE934_02600 [Sphingopyxis sp.]|nr:hypothetical protein [Sphingopyxis sp.]